VVLCFVQTPVYLIFHVQITLDISRLCWWQKSHHSGCPKAEAKWGQGKCNGFDHPECGWCEWISKMFRTPFGCVLSTQCQTDGWKRMLIPPGINRAGAHGYIHSKKELNSDKSLSGLRELSDWRLSV